MAISYYDEAITQKIKGWLADNTNLRVLSPDESTRLIQLAAEDSGDQPLKLPLIAISRNKDIEISSAIKQNKSFDGLILGRDASGMNTIHMNVIPIKTTYQIDIYTKKRIEADEYVRQYLFKLINNPQIVINITYNNFLIKHTANLRVLDTVSDTSDISTHIFPGQFYKWTIQLELHDGFLFSIPIKKNWQLSIDFKESSDKIIEVGDDEPDIETSTKPNLPNTGSTEPSKPEEPIIEEKEDLDNWEIIIENV
jgi:hypothetical protein